jgi:hypothetical protein
MSTQPLEEEGGSGQARHGKPRASPTTPPLQPGESELLLKLRGIEPATFPALHSAFPLSVGQAQLRYGVRDEAYCRRQLAAYEASYRPLLGVAPDELTSLSG